MTRTPNEDKGISRIDSGTTKGWFVRGYRNGKTYAKLFSDRKFGGYDRSLEKAREFRDKLHQKLADMKKTQRKRRVAFRDSRNKTGVLGVCRTTKKGPAGAMNEVYSVTWRPQAGVQKCTSFSIRKYGEEKAFKLAVAYRKKMMKSCYSSDDLKHIQKQQKEHEE